jgi:hypothetical protein
MTTTDVVGQPILAAAGFQPAPWGFYILIKSEGCRLSGGRTFFAKQDRVEKPPEHPGIPCALRGFS